MTCCSARTRRRSQRGQGLLLLMLVMLVAGASVLLAGIGSRASLRAGNDDTTARALALAKEALIAWAVSHPGAPGQLPFPDRGSDPGGFDGLSDCVSTPTPPPPLPPPPPVASNLLLGQLPWRGDDAPGSGCLSQIPTWPLISELRDGSGQPLWYAVSNRLVFEGVQARLNIGLLDGVADGSWLTVRDRNGVISDRVAAVIIAPGEASGAQDRGVAIDNPSYPAQFLDSVDVGGTSYSNADTDGDFIVHEAALPDDASTFAFNDRMVYITADELLRAVERRVLGEVAAALWAYRQANGAYPWLSPFVAPASGSSAAFDGVPGTRVGHIAMNDGGDSDIASPHVQDTGFTITWNAGGVTPVLVSELDIPLGSLNSLLEPFLPAVLALVFATMGVNVDADLASGMESFAMPQAPTGGDPSSCAWRGADIADCQGTTPAEDAGYPINVTVGPLSLVATSVQRQYMFDVSYSGTSATAPLDGARVRNVASAAPFQNYPPATVSTITVRHEAELSLPLLGTPVARASVTRRLDITDGSAASVAVDGMYFEPVEGGSTVAGDLRLPDWFYANQWHHFVLVEYAGNALPGESLATGTACTPGANCVNLDVRDDSGAIGVTLDDLHAVVIGAGMQLVPGQDRFSGSAVLGDFFEEKNADDADATAERRPWRSVWNFNDQARPVRQPSF